MRYLSLIVFASVLVFGCNSCNKEYRDPGSWSPVVKNVLPAVVQVWITDIDETGTRNWVGMGSGFIIHPSGIIVTNQHVVSYALGDIEEDEQPPLDPLVSVKLSNGREYMAYQIRASKLHDIAVLKIKTGYKLPYLEFETDHQPQVGDRVAACGTGFPWPFMFTTGTITGLNVVPIDKDRIGYWLDKQAKERGYGWLMVGSTINRGNSGGPLVNWAGKVVGVVQIGDPYRDGMWGGLPVSSVLRTVVSLLSNKPTELKYAGSPKCLCDIRVCECSK